MRKLIAIFIAVCMLAIHVPVSSFAKGKDKTHKTHKQRKKDKKQKKKWAKRERWANHFREPRGKHVGEHMFKRQSKKEQKKRSKHHLKP